MPKVRAMSGSPPPSTPMKAVVTPCVRKGRTSRAAGSEDASAWANWRGRGLGGAEYLFAPRAKGDIGGESGPGVAGRLAEAGFAVAARARRGDAEGAGDVGIAAAIDADEGGGDALRQKGEDEPRGGVGGRERLAHMGVRIDEAGRDDRPGHVDRARRGPGRLGADVGDAVAADRDVAAKGRGLAAIDGAAAQDQVGAAIGLRDRKST